MYDRKPETTVQLNALQLEQLRKVEAGNGRYWPYGRVVSSLKALANRRLVEFSFGVGWSILPRGRMALKEYENV